MKLNKNIRFLTVFILAIIFSLVIDIPVRADLDIKGESAILIEAASGDVLYELDVDKRWYPASMTKLMTLVVALDLIEKGQLSLDEKVITSENAAGYGGAQLYLEVGETFSLDDMLKAIIIGSANDASVAVAEHIAGSEEAFATLMNKKAKEIGCTNTNFVNSHGLHNDDHYTTARDMAIIGQYSLRYPKTLEYTALDYYEFREEPPTARYSINKLLWWYPGTDGFKTGTTDAAKRNLAATVSRDGLRLISVVMGVDEPNGHFRETMKLFNYGFSKYIAKQFFEANKILGEVRIAKGSVDTLDVVTEQDISITIRKGEDEGYSTKVDLVPYLLAPVSRGAKAGELIIFKDGQEIKKIDLVTASDASKGSLLRMIAKVFKSVFIYSA